MYRRPVRRPGLLVLLPFAAFGSAVVAFVVQAIG
jgi:hypothetical protein